MKETTRFIQIHWLSSYPAALLNRDDAGMAKRIPFGGSTRARVSSQCLKRHWRLAGQDSLDKASSNQWALQNVGIPMGTRSKRIVEERIIPEAQAGLTPSEELCKAVRSVMLQGLYGQNAEDPKKRQALLFGEPEVEYLTKRARAAFETGDVTAATELLQSFFKSERKNLATLKNAAGLESALFGRMITSDPSANRDAAIHVAHALTVHPIERELDFMTVVDDLKAADPASDSGAAGVFDMELASGVYYGYVVVDLPLLTANVGGDPDIAAKVIAHLIHLIAEVSPGAKKGSTAPYAFAEFMLVETGNRQPRTLANAFRKAVSARHGDIAEKAIVTLDTHLQRMDETYGANEERRQLSILDTALTDIEQVGLDDLAKFAAASRAVPA